MNFGNIKDVVASGYDTNAENYADWAAAIYSPERDRLTRHLIETLPPSSKVLELGCGNGRPTARILSNHFRLTGVDISSEQLKRARIIGPNATFIQGDMAALEFPRASFSTIVALFSIIHLPRAEHLDLFDAIFRWLQPGGLFIFNSAASGATIGYEEDWLGAPMAWSHHDPETTRQLVIKAGFEIQSQRVETINEGDGVATFVWWTTKKADEE